MRSATRSLFYSPVAILLTVLLLGSVIMSAQTASNSPKSDPPTLAEAKEFIQHAETRLNDLNVKANRAAWVQSNFITDDTEQMSAEANEAFIGATTELAKQATRYDQLQMPAELARKMLLLKLSAAVPAPAPTDPKELTELTRIGTSLEADYGKGKYCPKAGPNAGKCLDIGQIEQIMATSTDPEELKDVWVGWHSIAPPSAIAIRAGLSWATKARARWGSPISETCGAPGTT
jgi:peptidyl-dipeptidase A